MSVYDYNETASSNTSVGGVNVDEGCSPAGINNAIRAVMADLAKKHSDENGGTPTTGSGNAYALATAQSFSAYADGMFFVFQANHTNTGAATLNVDTIGAKNIYRQTDSDGTALVAGNLQQGCIYAVSYNTAANCFYLLNPTEIIATDWTPELADATTGGNTGSGTFSGRYVTDGKSVTVWGTLQNIDTTGMTAGNVAYVRGLPFSRSAEVGASAAGSVQVTQCGYSDTPSTWVSPSTDYVFFRSAISSGVPSTLKVSDLTSGTSDLYFTVTYERA